MRTFRSGGDRPTNKPPIVVRSPASREAKRFVGIGFKRRRSATELQGRCENRTIAWSECGMGFYDREIEERVRNGRLGIADGCVSTDP